jgi:hypothetical protein
MSMAELVLRFQECHVFHVLALSYTVKNGKPMRNGLAIGLLD